MPINKKIFSFFFFLPRIALATWGLFLPQIVFAQAQAKFTNPLGDNATVEGALTGLIWFMLSFIGLLALAGIIYGGIRIITGFGNQSSVEQGKKVIFYAIVGLILTALSALIVGLVANAINLKGAAP